MKFRIMGARALVLCLGFLMINAGSALAASATLSGVAGNSCSPYTSFAVDGSGNLSVTCPSSGSPSNSPICSLVAYPTTQPSGGGTSVLTATCSPAATAYAWSGGDGTAACSPALSTCSVSPTTAGVHTYTVSGSTSADVAANTPSATVTVSSPPVNVGSCTVIPITWPAGTDKRTGLPSSTPKQFLPAGKTYAFSIVLPAVSLARTANTSYMAGIPKDIALSTTACTFTEGLSNTYCKSLGEASINSLRYASTTKAGYCQLPATGTTVYFNVRNGLDASGADKCPAGGSGCEFYFGW